MHCELEEHASWQRLRIPINVVAIVSIVLRHTTEEVHLPYAYTDSSYLGSALLSVSRHGRIEETFEHLHPVSGYAL